jgi:HAD superfamily phosphatase (TIGR01668 family)
MFKMFYPDAYIDSIYDMDFKELWNQGVRGLIFDVDNTLVMHGAPATSEAIELFLLLNELGFKVVLVSNNKELRVKMFFEQVKATAYIYKAGKPSRKSYLKAMKIMKTNKKSTVFVGDQLFTDVWGAKRAQVYGILVKPINPKEEIQIVLKRKLERIVLYFYKKEPKKN